MEYIENPKCKELLKQKNYRETALELKREIQLNLIRVHNLYSDNKLDEKNFLKLYYQNMLEI